ncbi:MAG: hypothetical protein ACREP9_15640, partial [Candidatus Dormibacteraceae bacterium]
MAELIPRRSFGMGIQAVALSGLVLALEYIRVLAARRPGWELTAILIGGLALTLVAVGKSRVELGLAGGCWLERVVGGAAMAVILLLPAAVR